MPVSNNPIFHSKPVVVFDIDGVLCDFALGFSRLASTIFLFKTFTTEEQSVWAEFRRRGLSYDDVAKVWEIVDDSNSWWETVPPLSSLAEDRISVNFISGWFEIHYVTNRYAPQNVGEQTERWLREHGFPEGQVHIVKDKASYVQETFGSRLLGAIDDNPHNIEEYASLGLPIYVRDWQFNKDTCPELPRVSSVKEFCFLMLLEEGNRT